MLNDAYSIPFEARIYQSYLSGIKNHWRTSLYQQVIKEVSDLQTTNIDEIESCMLSSPSYQLYAWQERMTQQFKYIGRGGIKTTLEKSRKELLDILQSYHIDVRIIGEEYQDKIFTGKELDIETYYNKRRHSFSTTELRKRVQEAESLKSAKNDDMRIASVKNDKW